MELLTENLNILDWKPFFNSARLVLLSAASWDTFDSQRINTDCFFDDELNFKIII